MMAFDENHYYWKTKELLELLSDALFVGEFNEDELKFLHGQLCFAAKHAAADRFFNGTQRGVRLRAIVKQQQKLEAKEKIARLKLEAGIKK